MLLEEILTIGFVIRIITPAGGLAQFCSQMKNLLSNVSPGKQGYHKFFARKRKHWIRSSNTFYRPTIHNSTNDLNSLKEIKSKKFWVIEKCLKAFEHANTRLNEVGVLFILLARSDVATRPGVIYCYTAKGCVGVGDNFTRLAIFNKQNGRAEISDLADRSLQGQQKKYPVLQSTPKTRARLTQSLARVLDLFTRTLILSILILLKNVHVASNRFILTLTQGSVKKWW